MDLTDHDRACNALASTHEFLDSAHDELADFRAGNEYGALESASILIQIESLMERVGILYKWARCKEGEL